MSDSNRVGVDSEESTIQKINHIRAKLREFSTHPDAIDVAVNRDEVTLTGAILGNEVAQIENAIRSIPGIKTIKNNLSLLYLTSQRRRKPLLKKQVSSENFIISGALSNLQRTILGISGGALAVYGGRRRDLGGVICIGLGLGALIRAVSDIETAQLFQFVLHPTVQLERTIDIDAPIEEVYEFWTNFRQYPRFMSYVRQVKVNDKNGISWTLVGPRNIPVQWDAQLSKLVLNQSISWESIPGGLIKNSGQIELRSKDIRKTQVNIRLTYAPPAGVLGYEIIKILGFDPRDRIDGDLLIMKNLIEKKI